MRTGLRQHTIIGCNAHCKTTQKCTSLHFVDRINRSGSQRQGCQSLGQNSTEFNFFANVPRHYTGLLMFRSFWRTYSWLLICIVLHSHFSKSKCTLCFHQLGLYHFFACSNINCLMATFSLSFSLYNNLCNCCCLHVTCLDCH